MQGQLTAPGRRGHLQLVSSPPVIDHDAETDAFCAAVAKTAAALIGDVDPRNPQIDLLRTLVRELRNAAGLPRLEEFSC